MTPAQMTKLKEKEFIIGSTVTIDSAPDEYFIQCVEKMEWKYLRGEHGEDRQELFEAIFNRLKEFRLGLYLIGVDIGYKRVQWLGACNFISAESRNGIAIKHENLIQEKYVNKFILNSNGEMVSYLSKVDNQETEDNNQVYEYSASGNLLDFNKDDFAVSEFVKVRKHMKAVTKADWTIENVFEIPPDVYKMIMTINQGWQYFQKTDGWDRFNMYRQQAYGWMQDDFKYDPNAPMDIQLAFVKAERERCLENSLYLLNKYMWLKDPDDKIKGETKFKAWKSQEALLFFIDLGLSLMVGKLRQIGLTTVIGGLMGLRTMLSKNFYCKMCAQKGDKSEEIFDAKIKFPISKMEPFMKPTIANWATEKVRFGYTGGKGESASTESIFEVCAPAVDAINGGTPAVTLLDEIGYMKLFGSIMEQGRPTMFKYDPVKNVMKMTKQVIAWGTGGSISSSGSDMEVEWKAAKVALQLRNFRHGIIPLFLNYYCKPGHDDKFYLQEKEYYYAKKKEPGKTDPRIAFHQSFPITEDDMFLQSANTVISIAQINLQIERINKKIAAEKLVERRGYFEPIYNTEKPRGESAYVPYEIIGARFVPADESMINEDSPFACISIYDMPEPFRNRYYKGTDPIVTSSGHSRFSTTIKDKKHGKRTAAKMNYKSEDYRYEYLQSLLLNLYYSPEYGGRKLGIDELLEFNVGGEYYNFCRDLGYGGIFTGNKMLSSNLQTSTMDIGISKKGHNATAIVNRLEEMLIETASQIDSIDFWIQCKTFVKKETPTGFKYEPENKKIHWDDEIDSETYAYIAIECFQHMPITALNSQSMNYKEKSKLKYYYDANYNLRIGTQAQANKVTQRVSA